MTSIQVLVFCNLQRKYFEFHHYSQMKSENSTLQALNSTLESSRDDILSVIFICYLHYELETIEWYTSESKI